MLAPGANGTIRVMVSAESELLNPPLCGCSGGTSSVVPWTVTMHGVPAGAHVAGSLTTTFRIGKPVLARKSAKPTGTGKIDMSITRKRSRVTGEPVMLVNRLLMSSVPRFELLAGSGVGSRTRFGGDAAPIVLSSRKPGIVLFR